MIRLGSFFSPKPTDKIVRGRQLKMVRSTSLVYGSIHQTRMTSNNSITAQISQLISDTLSERKLIQDIVLAIDLISTSNAISNGKAQKIAIKTLRSIDQQFPNLRDRFVGITDDENTLPLQAILITGALSLEEIDNEHLFVME